MNPIESLLVSAVLLALLLAVEQINRHKGSAQALRMLTTTRHAVAKGLWMGLLLFVLVIYGSYAFLMPYLLSLFGFAGVLIGGFAAIVVIYFIYAYLVKRTGAKPTL